MTQVITRPGLIERPGRQAGNMDSTPSTDAELPELSAEQKELFKTSWPCVSGLISKNPDDLCAIMACVFKVKDEAVMAHLCDQTYRVFDQRAKEARLAASATATEPKSHAMVEATAPGASGVMGAIQADHPSEARR